MGKLLNLYDCYLSNLDCYHPVSVREKFEERQRETRDYVNHKIPRKSSDIKIACVNIGLFER